MPDIILTTSRGTSNNPSIAFTGTSAGTISLQTLSDGQLAFMGASGSLLNVTDSLTGSLHSVSDISGIPILEVFSDDRVVLGKYGTNALVVNGSYVGIGTATPSQALSVSGNVTITGSLSKGSGSFRIPHPLPEKKETHQLVHSFIESPKADLIYRGKAVLVAGKADVNIDESATMTNGTFEVLCREIQYFVTNATGWSAVRATVTGNILSIECEDITSTDTVSWLVIGERKDEHMINTEWTDETGRVIVEPVVAVVTPPAQSITADAPGFIVTPPTVE
jgi:hypothetical protein